MTPKTGEVLPAERDHGRASRRWWREKNLGDAADLTTLGQAMLDVSRLALAHLAKTLDNPRTSVEDKTRIALALAPRLLAETRGRPGKDRRGLEEAPSADLGALLDSYKVTMRTPS